MSGIVFRDPLTVQCESLEATPRQPVTFTRWGTRRSLRCRTCCCHPGPFAYSRLLPNWFPNWEVKIQQQNQTNWRKTREYHERNAVYHKINLPFCMFLFFLPVLDDPVVLATFRTVSNQQHCMTQIVRVTVGLFKYSCRVPHTHLGQFQVVFVKSCSLLTV